MAYAGAHGQTATEMAHVFHFTLPPERLHPAMGALLAGMNAPAPGIRPERGRRALGREG